MVQYNKKSQEANRDRLWASIREKKESLIEIIGGKKDFVPMDFILFYQCLSIVIEDITLYEDDFIKTDEKIDEILDEKTNKNIEEILEDGTISDIIAKIVKEVKYFNIVDDKTKSTEKRIEAIEKIRKSIWGDMAQKKDKLIELTKKFPLIKEPIDFTLLFQCVSLIIMELELSNTEINIINGNI